MIGAYKLFYRGAIYPAILAGARIGSLFHRKLRLGFQIHRGARGRWREKSKFLPGEKLRIWFHATSTGEFETARPVMEHAKRLAGDRVSIIFTYYSPSVHRAAQDYALADMCEVLPLDTTSSVRAALRHARPHAIVFVRYDTWPNLIWEAGKNGVKLFLIDAILRQRSFRFFGPPGRSFSRSFFREFAYIGAVSKNDARRFQRLASKNTQIEDVGDSRFDRIMARKAEATRVAIPRQLTEMKEPIFICGSTWPSDENRLIPAISQARKSTGDFHVVLVPHEPSPARLQSIRDLLKKQGLSAKLFSELEKGLPVAAVTILDRVGFLAEFYRIGSFCYVGGGFLYSGVHNCVEPAAMGLPLCFGPRHQNAPEAQAIIDCGAARVAATQETMLRQLLDWLENPKATVEQGRKSLQFVESRLGASETYARAVLRHLQIA